MVWELPEIQPIEILKHPHCDLNFLVKVKATILIYVLPLSRAMTTPKLSFLQPQLISLHTCVHYCIRQILANPTLLTRRRRRHISGQYAKTVKPYLSCIDQDQASRFWESENKSVTRYFSVMKIGLIQPHSWGQRVKLSKNLHKRKRSTWITISKTVHFFKISLAVIKKLLNQYQHVDATCSRHEVADRFPINNLVDRYLK